MKTIKVKNYSELDLETRAKVLDKYRHINVDDDWYEHIYEAFKEKAEGFEVSKIYFSGFSSQGDGAMFEGRYLLDEGYWEVRHRGHYYHAYSRNVNTDLPEEQEKLIDQQYLELCHWLYKELEQAYDYLTSDEMVAETLVANDYHFDDYLNTY